jgi:hypothetical protein
MIKFKIGDRIIKVNDTDKGYIMNMMPNDKAILVNWDDYPGNTYISIDLIKLDIQSNREEKLKKLGI